MSTPKRSKNTAQKNTILNYFQSPKQQHENINSSSSSPTATATETAANAKLTDPITVNENCNDNAIVKKNVKRRRIITSDSESSDNENVVPNEDNEKTLTDSNNKETPRKKSLKRFKNDASLIINDDTDTSVLTNLDDAEFLKDQSMNHNISSNTTKTITNCPTDSLSTNWLHNRLDFLKPENILDANKHRPDHPDFDKRTLYVPNKYLDSVTPAQRQWWLMKAQTMDSVLFFKVGKFYELYHMDAVIGVNHLGFSYMKGEMAHSGFPESAYYKMVNSLVAKGFKVARCEQTETPEMMALRCKRTGHNSRFDKVVTREICQISTKATRVYNAQLPDATNSLPCYLFAICEKDCSDITVKLEFGICFVDTSIGTFHLAQFVDDKHLSHLLAILAYHPIGLILTERRCVSKKLKQILSTFCRDIKQEELKSGAEFYSATKSMEKLLGGQYFYDENNKQCLPDLIEQIRDGNSTKSEYQLMVKSLGACLWYLEHSKLDLQVISMGKFQLYDSILTSSTTSSDDNRNTNKKYMILDGVTIRNLNLLGDKYSLEAAIDFCHTAFGKRLLHQWICRPLYNIDEIKERQLAVEELKDSVFLKSCQQILHNLPDLERQLAKMHHYGNKNVAQNHPDSRAILYESATYSKRRIEDLLRTLKAFERTLEIPALFNNCECTLLKRITQVNPIGDFIDLTESLTYFKDSFDQKQAQETGKIIPQDSMDVDYDTAKKTIAEVEQKLMKYKREQEKFFGCKLSYFGSDKKRYQLDIPEAYTHKATNDYRFEGRKKGKQASARYTTIETRELLADMMKAESDCDRALQNINRSVFEKFSERHKEWEAVIKCLTILDVLCSLAEYASTFSAEICLPTFQHSSIDNVTLVIKDGRNPCVTNISTYIPNDVEIGGKEKAELLVITGPNMGGKSTLMRQIALISIMAQIGGYVPASYCLLNPIDRIFTRVGADDDIIHGNSTFLVELSEASTILRHATRHSLIVVDELGRGTSTHDGNAIAMAYIEKLITIKARTLFSTHYHNLPDQYKGRSDVQLGHMACLVGNGDDDESAKTIDSNNEQVTFLYKLIAGHSEKSYGFNVAALAGLKTNIVQRAREIAVQLETDAKHRLTFYNIFSNHISDMNEIAQSLVVV